MLFLYTYTHDNNSLESKRTPNLNPEIISEIEKSIGIEVCT